MTMKLGMARAGLVALFAAGCSPTRPPDTAIISAAQQAVSMVPDPAAQACSACHPKEFAAWQESQHARANRLVSHAEDGAAFNPPRTLQQGSFVTQLRPRKDGLEIRETGPDGTTSVHVPEAVIGITPLRQYLVPFPGGRLQTMDISFDPRSNEWFKAFGAEDRRPHEWGYWKNRSMNWNTQCAFCHMTDFRKNYDPTTDAYNSAWKAMGISCAQCHVAVRPVTRDQCPMTGTVQRAATIENCASCHSRREQMTDTYQPGDRYHDHFRLTLADNPATFYPDGQIRDENFEYNSFMMSRMGHQGITCLDCHDPHSYKLKLPVQGNALCLSCHLAPGQKNATVIDPATHSHHALTGPGSSCVECHMTHTTYMQRDPRRDHGFTSPDPLLTRELGIPNACNKCHTDKSVDWSINAVDQWYGDKMEQRRARQRARVIARAQAGDGTNLSNLLAMARSEEIISWRATLLTLMQPWAASPETRALLQESLAHEHPLIRSAAVNALRETEGTQALLKPLRHDPARLVRLDAAWATLHPIERDPASYAELVNYLNTVCDQPAGAIRQGQKALTEGLPGPAETWMRKAALWDPSAVPLYLLGRVLHQNGKLIEAESMFVNAAAYDPLNTEYPYTLALFYAETDRPRDALALLQKTVEIAPDFARAWYNLGLAYAGEKRMLEAMHALSRAETLMPQSADVPYALATLHLQAGSKAEARAAAQRALLLAPDYEPAQNLLNAISR